ncbi:lytic transglycosylase domain-containing protein [Magnetospirillum molischianum]|uniref:Uncharacterized protein n=1 Tax=Magnetospirillum molischianum DSM 120 TaxID=1150626 RepID=H8FWB5_MAGML|nr:hypothetical protein [Magnetospirillum molischianum]CCG42653.1 conserved hypothetical protein [Magnetospirillum molischianum DSM 120]
MVERINNTPRTEDLLAELAAARVDLTRIDHATRLVRAQSQLESLLQTVRIEAATGNLQRMNALAGEALRIVQTLNDGTATRYPSEVEQARSVALRIKGLCEPPADGSVKIEV